MTSTCPHFSTDHELLSLCSKLFIFERFFFPLSVSSTEPFVSFFSFFSPLAIDSVFLKFSAVFTSTQPRFCAGTFTLGVSCGRVIKTLETSLIIFNLREKMTLYLIFWDLVYIHQLAAIPLLCVNFFTIMFNIREIAGFSPLLPCHLWQVNGVKHLLHRPVLIFKTSFNHSSSSQTACGSSLAATLHCGFWHKVSEEYWRATVNKT